MSIHENSKNVLDSPIDITKQKKLNKFLGTHYFLNKIRNIPTSEIGNFRLGAFALSILFGLSSYYFYRKYLEQRIVTSEGYYKLTQLTPLEMSDLYYKQMESNDNNAALRTVFYRMPKKEFDVLYRLRAVRMYGEFDHNKEILVPKSRNGREGYDVITPFYYYLTPILDQFNKDTLPSGKLDDVRYFHRSAIAVKRGW